MIRTTYGEVDGVVSVNELVARVNRLLGRPDLAIDTLFPA
jgi:hypothetical protein